MARIPVYEAPDRLLHTEEKGFAAFETAGRRIGPAYDKASTDVRDIGNLNASILKERLWPWDILELEQRLGDSSGSGSSRGGGAGGGGINVKAGGTEHLGSPGGGGAGAVGRLGRVAADMANDFTGHQSRLVDASTGKSSRSGGGGEAGGRGGTLLDTETGSRSRGGRHGSQLIDVGDDPPNPRIISDPRPLSPITFPDKVGESTVIPRGRDEQPANPDAIRRSAEQGVFETPLPPLPGYDSNGYNGGRTDTPDAPPPPDTSFGQRIWNGINAAAEWLGGAAPGTENPDQPYYASPAPAEDASPAPAEAPAPIDDEELKRQQQ